MIKDEEYWKYHGKPNCVCTVCGKAMYIRPNRLKKCKHGVTCSLKCSNINRSKWFSGENNHQYGLKGSMNASYKGYRKINSYGYILIHKENHPFCNCDGNVFEHRLVIEENANKLDEKFFVVIEGKKYLKKEYEVHHKNEIKTDNRFENLEVLTKSEHRKLHDKQQIIIRRRNGMIYSWTKKNKAIPIRIKLYGDGKIPIRKTNGAACFDCFSNEKVMIHKGERRKVKLGFGLDMPYMFEAIIRPRSGLTARGIDCFIGTIDEDFKSEISAVLENNSEEDFAVNVGDRICQLAIREYMRFSFEEVSELTETERGESGFGSTGVR